MRAYRRQHNQVLAGEIRNAGRLTVTATNKLLLFGGTFDPVHNGHVEMFNCAVDTIHPDRVLVVPVGNPWQKQRMPFVSAEHRCAMLKIALPNVPIDDRELKREGPTYTVDSLRELGADYPSTSFYWLIGSDSFATLDTWREPASLAALATFAVVRRGNDKIVRPEMNFCFSEVICTPPPVSSTRIREMLARRESIRGLVPNSVCDYIQQHNLYCSK